jgi:hypothetical protein
MPTVQQRIAAADRQIERMKLRLHRQMVHAAELEQNHHEREAERARVSLELMLAELSRLQRLRLSLYQEAAFADVPKRKAS